MTYCFFLKRFIVKDIFNLEKMSIQKVAQLLALLLISQQARFISSSPLNLPPIRGYLRYERFIGKANHLKRGIPLTTWSSHDIGATIPEFIRKRATDSEYEDSFWIEDEKDKRAIHRTARIYKNKFGKCLIINKTGKVEASTGHICNTYGKFCHISNGSRLQLLGIKAGKYLAIDDNARIYSTTNRLSNDTKFSYELGNLQTTWAVGIYRRKTNNKKCYLKVLSNAIKQTCSLSPRYLEPVNAGTC